MNEGLCKVSDFGVWACGLVSALCLFFAVLTVSDTKKPLLLRETGVFSRKVGGFLGKGVGFKPNSKRIAAELFRERPLLTSWDFRKAKSS